MSFGGQTPTIIVLKEGTDSSQGKGQIISNIQACLSVHDTIRSTLGPYGGDLLLVDANGKQTITNDGATVMKVPLIVWSDRKFDADSEYPASRHCSSRRSNTHGHRPLARRRSRRWNNISGRFGWRNTERGQGACRAGNEFANDHQGSEESVCHGRQ